MKNKFLMLIAASAILFTACKKGATVQPEPTPTPGSGIYQPLTNGSTWKYRNTVYDLLGNTTLDTSIVTMSGTNYLLDNKAYRAAKSVTGADKQTVYYGYNNNIYSFRNENTESGEGFDMPYLDANAPVDASWITPVNIAGSAIPMQLKTTILQKDLTKVVLGKTYTDVIRTQVEVQYKHNNVYETTLIHTFYAAKGVGLIQMQVETKDDVILNTKLIDHTIK